jgi:hypothetical protein
MHLEARGSVSSLFGVAFHSCNMSSLISTLKVLKKLAMFPVGLFNLSNLIQIIWEKVLSRKSKSGRIPNSAVVLLGCDLLEGQSYKCNTVGIL